MHKVLAEISHLLGVPLKEEKPEGRATSIVFLGMELDTVEGTVSNQQGNWLIINRKWCYDSAVEAGSTSPDRQTFSCL